MVVEPLSRISGLPPVKVLRILKFLMVGGSVNLLMILAIIGMERIGIGYDIALFVTNIVGLCLNYFLNRQFVFGDQNNILKTALLYMAVYASVYVLQLVIYRLIFATGWMHDYIAIVITIGLSAIYAYIMLEKVVFPGASKADRL